MQNIKLTIAYDGSEFHGWQFQSAKPTIQGTLTEIAKRLTGDRIQIHGASRTDAGVHALGQVAHFRTKSAMTAEQFRRAFNALLPASIRIMSAEEVAPDFHSRWHAQGKTYQYRIYRGRVLPPSEHRYVLHDPYPLDAHAMARAAALFEGEHDFTSFAASTGNEEADKDRSMVRQIFRSRLLGRRGTSAAAQGFSAAISTEEIAFEACAGASNSDSESAPCEPAELIYEIRGRSFLRYMVRKIVGTLLEVGRGRLTVDDIP